MTAKTSHQRVRMAGTIAALLLIPVAVGFGLTNHFNFGQWAMAFGLTGLAGLMLTALLNGVTLGDKDVG